jgi:hypothetical protein
MSEGVETLTHFSCPSPSRSTWPAALLWPLGSRSRFSLYLLFLAPFFVLWIRSTPSSLLLLNTSDSRWSDLTGKTRTGPACRADGERIPAGGCVAVGRALMVVPRWRDENSGHLGRVCELTPGLRP